MIISIYTSKRGIGYTGTVKVSNRSNYGSVRKVHSILGINQVGNSNSSTDSDQPTVGKTTERTSVTYRKVMTVESTATLEEKREIEAIFSKFEVAAEDANRAFRQRKLAYDKAKASVLEEYGYSADTQIRTLPQREQAAIKKRLSKDSFYYWTAQMVLTTRGENGEVLAKTKTGRFLNGFTPFKGFEDTAILKAESDKDKEEA